MKLLRVHLSYQGIHGYDGIEIEWPEVNEDAEDESDRAPGFSIEGFYEGDAEEITPDDLKDIEVRTVAIFFTEEIEEDEQLKKMSTREVREWLKQKLLTYKPYNPEEEE